MVDKNMRTTKILKVSRQSNIYFYICLPLTNLGKNVFELKVYNKMITDEI